ncbi:MAG: YgjV family protein [Treponema sp.]|nr:YgjV family protein [Treponema sp.]MCL2273088.1 YgjV family protein [Treponema sp.]
MVNWIGYLASLLVAISITITGGIYFRLINLAGSFCFLTYGILIKNMPVILINSYSICINIFHIIKLKRTGSKKEKIETAS